MSRRGFTLIEILCVLAIVGTLCGLLFPAFGNARRAAAVARTKTQFAQWTAATESFRGEYGYYPVFATNNLVNGGVTLVEHPFHDILAGRHRDGSALATGSSAASQNRRAITFCVFNGADFNDAKLLQDASGHSVIAVLVDRDLDGVIKMGADFSALPLVDGLSPDLADFPASGVRAGVLFYALAPGATPINPAFVCSWK
jgi:prepilin-type N-terminal cleavage/methylation domain-containing protein